MSRFKGLEALLGQRVTLFCVNYIYTGRLMAVTATFAFLTEPEVVYETGPLDSEQWKDAEPLPGNWYVRLLSIESFGVLK